MSYRTVPFRKFCDIRWLRTEILSRAKLKNQNPKPWKLKKEALKKSCLISCIDNYIDFILL